MLAALKECLTQLGFDKTYWVAFSGGMDSHVLLTLCHELRQSHSFKLNAIYINHGLNPRADAWSEHCKKICDTNKINLIESTVKVNTANGLGLEAAARAERYRVLAEYMNPESVLLTAHHQDDQAETLLLQLLRGAGLKGLSAMPKVKPFAQGQHARPLLSFSRAELEAFAKERQLHWVEDDSNANTAIQRNFVRHEVIPLLKARWPTMNATLARSAVHLAEAQVLLEEYLSEDCLKAVGSQEGTLSVRALSALSSAKVRHILRTWIQKRGFPLPDTNKIISIEQDVLTAAWDRSPCVEWQGTELRRCRDDLYLLQPLAVMDKHVEFQWNLDKPLLIPGVGTLHAAKVQGKGLRSDLPALSVRFRRGGESLYLPRRGRHTLKNLFQEWNVLPWLRDRVPLLFSGEQLIGVVGYAMDETFFVQAEEVGWAVALVPCDD